MKSEIQYFINNTNTIQLHRFIPTMGVGKRGAY